MEVSQNLCKWKYFFIFNIYFAFFFPCFSSSFGFLRNLKKLMKKLKLPGMSFSVFILKKKLQNRTFENFGHQTYFSPTFISVFLAVLLDFRTFLSCITFRNAAHWKWFVSEKFNSHKGCHSVCLSLFLYTIFEIQTAFWSERNSLEWKTYFVRVEGPKCAPRLFKVKNHWIYFQREALASKTSKLSEKDPP